MKIQAKKIRTWAHKSVAYTAQKIKPIAKGVCKWTIKHPEATLGAGAGYILGDFIDRTPFIGRITGGSGKWILGITGTLYGYNKALIRRQLSANERLMEKFVPNLIKGNS